ncbi:hypothetical protein DACRYDRAFT_110047 [Dacryopinax primogenitus]|uniref:ABM domain-containing protein n=1 Tax=Dacryopinax primogenitus (strain DJM 731) TaxID=1858805 RepID=M5FTE4_DACPD|nr:uncharacterized protein DACRYDRAFT_110047 [Dacryopinax primogenitus]EJT99328.1 hypothetical protein DACRYDRAFT_110047 [Dacryopinax primogenitus]
MSATFETFEGEVNVIVRVTAKPGKIQEVLEYSKIIKAWCESDAEPGCDRYEVLQVGDELCILEKYKDVAALIEHTKSEMYEKTEAKIPQLVVEGSLDVKFWQPAKL